MCQQRLCNFSSSEIEGGENSCTREGLFKEIVSSENHYAGSQVAQRKRLFRIEKVQQKVLDELAACKESRDKIKEGMQRSKLLNY